MLITHDTRCALDTVVDLVNTAPEGEQRRTGSRTSRRCTTSYEATASAMWATLGERDLAAVRGVRGAVRGGLRGARQPQRPPQLINELVAAAGTTPAAHRPRRLRLACALLRAGRLASPTISRPTAGWRWPSSSSPGEQERLRRCEAPDCRRAFVDLSRNRSRRYCDSRTCGNRLHVAAYRARRKEAAG